MSGSMGDPELVGQAFQVLNTIKFFIDCGEVLVLIDHEIKNYFMMCQQVEIFQEKFLHKGWVLAYDSVKGAYLTSLAHNKVDDDFGLLADRLLDRFCRSSVPTSMVSLAVKEYLDIYGASRFTKFLQVMTATRGSFNLTSIVGRAYENGYNLEGPVFMDCFEHIAMSPRGMSRVHDKINEFLMEDVCADTIVSMLAAESIDSEYYVLIKKAVLEKLEEKFKAEPKRRVWLLMVSSQNLLSAVNSYTPFMDFVLKLIGSLSQSITCDSSKNYHSPPGCITYKDLVHIMAKFYRNPKTTQHIVNFVFNQYKADPGVWGSILTACHDYPTETTAEKSLDSLYTNQFTDPNFCSESLQLMLMNELKKDADDLKLLSLLKTVQADTQEGYEQANDLKIAKVAGLMINQADTLRNFEQKDGLMTTLANALTSPKADAKKGSRVASAGNPSCSRKRGSPVAPSASSKSSRLRIPKRGNCKSILNRDHLLMASALGSIPPKTSAAMKSDLEPPGAPDLKPLLVTKGFSNRAASMELTDAAPLGSEDSQINTKPSIIKAEFGPCCHSKDLFPAQVESLVVAEKMVSGPADVAVLHRTPSRRWTVVELERRPLSTRVKRYPNRFNDFWV